MLHMLTSLLFQVSACMCKTTATKITLHSSSKTVFVVFKKKPNVGNGSSTAQLRSEPDTPVCPDPSVKDHWSSQSWTRSINSISEYLTSHVLMTPGLSQEQNRQARRERRDRQAEASSEAKRGSYKSKARPVHKEPGLLENQCLREYHYSFVSFAARRGLQSLQEIPEHELEGSWYKSRLVLPMRDKLLLLLINAYMQHHWCAWCCTKNTAQDKSLFQGAYNMIFKKGEKEGVGVLARI